MRYSSTWVWRSRWAALPYSAPARRPGLRGLVLGLPLENGADCLLPARRVASNCSSRASIRRDNLQFSAAYSIPPRNQPRTLAAEPAIIRARVAQVATEPGRNHEWSMVKNGPVSANGCSGKPTRSPWPAATR